MASDALELGRAAFQREAWSDAYAALRDADRTEPLSADDLERLGTAAYLIGEDAVCLECLSRAHQAHLVNGDPIRAARSAFWLAFSIIDKPGHQAQVGGWLARARRLLDERDADCVERGFLLCCQAFQRVVARDVEGAFEEFSLAAEIGARFGNKDLLALSRHGVGRTLLHLDRVADGFSMLDEVMVSVTCGEVSPIVTGVVYCSVLGACQERFDLGRAGEWTSALSAWCESHPDMVPFRGQCLGIRAQLLQLRGAWDDAIREAERVREGDPDPAVAVASYQLGEIHRLRGEWKESEEAYRRTGQAGRRPQPGLALLRLAAGDLEAASSAIGQALQETPEIQRRVPLLRAAVDIAVAAHDVQAAAESADALGRLAAKLPAPLLRAAAAQAAGSVALIRGEPHRALELFRDAWALWRDIDAPYEAARVRVLIGTACREMGDEEGAQLDFEAAAEVFTQLGAQPDAVRVGSLLTAAAPTSPHQGLTGREVEVLRLVASGKSNRTIAEALDISEKTVARHLSNIFTKLDLPSRSAATAYAYHHKLV